MKNTGIILILATLISSSLVSCKKSRAGCTDDTAENYNMYAKLDDGSCMYHVHSEITISSWSYNDPYYYAVVTWEALTQEVIDRGSYSIFLKAGDNWVELPIAYSSSASYHSYFETDVQAGKVIINRYDSDLTDPGDPGTWTFKVVAWW